MVSRDTELKKRKQESKPAIDRHCMSCARHGKSSCIINLHESDRRCVCCKQIKVPSAFLPCRHRVCGTCLRLLHILGKKCPTCGKPRNNHLFFPKKIEI